MFAFYSLADATPQFLLETKPLLIFNVVLTLEIEKKRLFQIFLSGTLLVFHKIKRTKVLGRTVVGPVVNK